MSSTWSTNFANEQFTSITMDMVALDIKAPMDVHRRQSS